MTPYTNLRIQFHPLDVHTHTHTQTDIALTSYLGWGCLKMYMTVLSQRLISCFILYYAFSLQTRQIEVRTILYVYKARCQLCCDATTLKPPPRATSFSSVSLTSPNLLGLEWSQSQSCCSLLYPERATLFPLNCTE